MFVLILSIVFINSSIFQSWTIRRVVSALEIKTNHQIEIDYVDFKLFKGTFLGGLKIYDEHEQLMIRADEVQALHFWNFFLGEEIDFDEIRIYGGELNLITDNKGELNLKKFLQHFKNKNRNKNSLSLISNHLDVNNFTFRLIDSLGLVEQKFGMNYSNLEVKNIFLDGNQFSLNNNAIELNIDHFQAIEKCGFQLNDFSCDFVFSSEEMSFNDLQFVSTESSFNGDVSFSYNSLDAYSNFNEEVKMHYQINEAYTHSDEIAYYAPIFVDVNKEFKINGIVEGEVKDLKGYDVNIWMDSTCFSGDFDISEVYVEEEMNLNFNIKELKSTYSQIIKFPFLEISLPNKLQSNEPFYYRGKLLVTNKETRVNGELKNSLLGKSNTDLVFEYDNALLKVNGMLTEVDFNYDQLEKNSLINNLKGDYSVKYFEQTKENPFLFFSTENASVVINNKLVNGVRAEARLENKELTCNLKVSDPNQKFSFDGTINLSEEIPYLEGELTSSKINLQKLGVYDSGDIDYSTNISFNIKGFNIDNFEGEITTHYLNATKNEQVYEFGILYLNSVKSKEEENLTFNSELFDLSLTGNYNISELYNNFKDEYYSLFESYNSTKSEVDSNQNFRYYINLKNTEFLSLYVSEDLNLDSKGIIQGEYNKSKSYFSFQTTDLSFDYVNLEVDSLNFDLKKEDEELLIISDVKQWRISEILRFNNNVIKLSKKGYELKTIFDWKNDQNDASITFTSNLKSPSEISFLLENIQFNLNTTKWKNIQNTTAQLDSNGFKFDGLTIQSGKQKIQLEGHLTEDSNSYFNTVLQDVELYQFNFMLPDTSIIYSGVFNGEARYSRNLNNGFVSFSNKASIDSFQINDYLIGKINTTGSWNKDTKNYLLFGNVLSKNLTTIDFIGKYDLDTLMNISFDLKETDLSVLNVYLSDDFYDFKALVNGKFSLTGAPLSPVLSGYFKVKDGGIGIGLSRTYYTFSPEVIMDNDLIYFNRTPVYDNELNKAFCTGTFHHRKFRDWQTDLFFETNFLKVMDNDINVSPDYYGKLYTSGYASFSLGYNQALHLEGNLDILGGTVFNIPLSSESSIEEKKFIQFLKTDTTEIEILGEEEDVFKFTMDLRTHLTPDAKVELIYDEKAGEKIKVKSEGDLRISYDENEEFNLFGELNILDGTYLFSFQNVINKKFNLDPGSKIRWNGDVYEGIVDLSATYNVRTSLKELAPFYSPDDENIDQEYLKTEEVLCILKVRNKLSNPDIECDIQFLNKNRISEEVKASLVSLTSSEQDMNLQFFSLLMFNKFWPRFSSQSSENNVFANTTSELLSNQISNWLSNISDDFDLNVKYDPGNSTGNQEIQVGFETEVLDDRLIIKGTAGYLTQNTAVTTNDNQNQLIGDFIVEYKLTKDGSFRVKAFNLTNDYNALSTNNNAQFTQGVGLYYQEGFDKVGEIKFFQAFKSLFNRKVKEEK